MPSRGRGTPEAATEGAQEDMNATAIRECPCGRSFRPEASEELCGLCIMGAQQSVVIPPVSGAAEEGRDSPLPTDRHRPNAGRPAMGQVTIAQAAMMVLIAARGNALWPSEIWARAEILGARSGATHPASTVLAGISGVLDFESVQDGWRWRGTAAHRRTKAAMDAMDLPLPTVTAAAP